MSHIPDSVIYLTGFTSTLFFVFFGIHYSSNKTVRIWTFIGGLVFGLLTGFLYWENDTWKIEQENKDSHNTTHVQPPSKATPPKAGKKLKVTSVYSALTNKQLQREVLILVDRMRSYLKRKNLQDRSQSDYYDQQMRNAKTKQERQIIWDASTHDSLTAPSLNFEYSEKFKADAVIFRRW